MTPFAKRFAALAIAVAGSMVSSWPSGRPTEDASLPLDIEFSGCAAVVASAQARPDEITCELSGDRLLTLWVDAPGGAIVAASTNGATLALDAGSAAGGGVRHHVRIPEGARELRLSVDRPPGRASWSLRLSEARSLRLLDEVKALREAGKLEAAEDRLRAALATASAEDRPRVLGQLARVVLARGRNDDAVVLFRAAIEGDREVGRLSDEDLDTAALAYTLVLQTRFADARKALERGAHARAAYPDGRARGPYYEGLVDVRTGDLRTALARFRHAEEAAERIGLTRLRQTAGQQLALALQSSGRTAEALARLQEMLRVDGPSMAPCDRADLYTSVGWVELLSHEALGGPAASTNAAATAPLEEALRLVRAPCSTPVVRANALLNLALAALQAGLPEKARARLEEARMEMPQPIPDLVLWWLEIEARVALATGRPEAALPLFERSGRIAAASLTREGEWRSAVGRGEALEAMGNLERADAAYARAETLLEDNSVWVPLNGGRDTFLGDRERSARLRVDLLLRLGRVREALGAVRRARARALAGAERVDRLSHLDPAARRTWDEAIGAYRRDREKLEREAAADWKVPADRLDAVVAARRAWEPRVQSELDEAFAVLDGRSRQARAGRDRDPPFVARPGELLIAFHPVRRGLAVFGADAAGVTADVATISASASDASTGAQLLAPLRARIAVAKRLRVLVYGATREIDFHALLWEGAPLVAHATVEYALDLPRQAALPEPSKKGRERIAVVVADPTGNLPAARREAKAVGDALASGAGWSVVALQGRHASSAAVLEALGRGDLLHYAGHGVFAGRGGWESAMPLARGRLSVGDILALPHAPAQVILSGCDTGRSSKDAPSEGVGLAHAFVAAGTAVVVAAVRPVDDALAADMMGALYRALGAGDGELDLPVALGRAQLSVREVAPNADWAAFRVVVR